MRNGPLQSLCFLYGPKLYQGANGVYRGISTAPLYLFLVTLLSVFCTFAHSQTWQPIGPDGGAVFVLEIDPANPATIYAGTERGGVFKSIDRGNTWRAINNGLPSINPFVVSALAVNPKISGTLYVASVDGVFKSIDGGTNWTQGNTGLTDTNVTALAIDPDTTSTIYAGTGSGIVFKSTDGASTWSPLSLSSTSITALSINPATPTTIYAAGSGGVFSSSDGGAHWSVANTGLPNVGANALVIDPNTPATLYAGTPFGGIFKTTNAGGTWTAANAGLTNNGTFALAIDPLVPATLYTSNNDGVFRTTDGGQTWTLISTSQGNTSFIRALAADLQTEGVIYEGAFGQGVFKSVDGGINWASSSAGLNATEISSLAVDPSTSTTLYATFTGDVVGGAFRSTNSGVSWSVINNGLTNISGLPLNASSVIVDPRAPTTLYIAGELSFQAAIFKSVDQGTSWALASLGLPQEFSAGNLTIDPNTPTTLYSLGSAGVSKSTDAGGHWSNANVGLTDTKANALVIDPSTPSTLYVGTNSTGVFKSTDSTGSWSATGLSNARITALAIDPHNPAILYAASFGSFFKSTDGGNNWIAINTGIPLSFIPSVVVDPVSSVVYAATEAFGVFRSADGGNTWNPMNDGLTNKTVRALIIDPNSGAVYAGTTGGGAFVLSQKVPAFGTISVSTNSPDASFTITDGNAHIFSGSGTSFTQSAPVGTYTITYGSIPGFISPPSETKNLTVGGTIAFTGIYVPIVPPPSVRQVTPQSGFQGQILTPLTVTGANFDSAATLSFTSNDIRVLSYQSRSNSQILAFVQIDLAAAAGPRDVIVTNSDKQSAIDSAAFTVQPVNRFLAFPLRNKSPFTAGINTVFDHSASLQYCPDGIVTAYDGEEGRAQFGVSSFKIAFRDCNGDKKEDLLHGYANSKNVGFTLAGQYLGAGDKSFLFYDGHPGYDYVTKDQKLDGTLCTKGTLCSNGHTEVLAAADGNIVCAEMAGCPEGPGEIKIDHKNGYFTIYLHLSEFRIKSGPVTKGQVIGVSGDTGAKDSPHLHFEVRFKPQNAPAIPVDPYGWFPLTPAPDPYTRALNLRLWE